MEKAYYRNQYLTELDSTLVEINGNHLVFEDSIFYPEGGGQPGDIGTIGDIPVLDTDKDGIIVADTASFTVGERYRQNIDWNHRYHYMVEHTAQHLISAVLFHSFGLHTVSVHMGKDIVTIELEEKDVKNEVFEKAEDIVNDMIRKGLKVVSIILSHKDAETYGLRRSIKVEGDVRIIKLDEYDAVGCGGVHLGDIREIKEVSFISTEAIRGHIRTSWKVGEDAVREKKENKRILSALSRLYSATGDAIVNSAEKDRQKIKELSYELGNSMKELAFLYLKDFEKEKKTDVLETKLPVSSFVGLVEKTDIKEILIINNENKEFIYYGSKESFDELKKKYDFKGGGKAPYFRGKLI